MCYYCDVLIASCWWVEIEEWNSSSENCLLVIDGLYGLWQFSFTLVGEEALANLLALVGTGFGSEINNVLGLGGLAWVFVGWMACRLQRKVNFYTKILQRNEIFLTSVHNWQRLDQLGYSLVREQSRQNFLDYLMSCVCLSQD